MVEPGSRVRTDGWRGYNGLAELGYPHDVLHKTAKCGANLLPLVNLLTQAIELGPVLEKEFKAPPETDGTTKLQESTAWPEIGINSCTDP